MERKTAKDVSKDLNNISEPIIQFMLAEMQILFESRKLSDELAEGRLNVYITITSGAIGILILLSQLQITSRNFLVVGLVIAVIIWVLGLITFRRMLSRNEVSVEYFRGLNRIRKFFADLDMRIEPYLSFPLTDDQPGFTSLGARKFGARTICSVISSISFGLLFGVLVTLLLQNNYFSTVAAIFSAISSIIHLVLIELFAYVRLKKVDDNYDVRFPTRNL